MNIYRYMSFETFVGMVQNQALVFVLPELWEDPKEYASFEYYISNVENPYERMALEAIRNKTFCQCWTNLSESDAMWRIYSYSNRAVRITINRNDIKLLDDVNAIDVKYTDSLNFNLGKGRENYLKLFTIKRIAFEHEKEVRLIKHYRFLNDSDLEQHIYSWLAISEHSKSIEVLENDIIGENYKDKVINISKTLNIGDYRKNFINISFSHIPEFIKGVLVHPLAPKWYVDIVNEFCIRNKIQFEGQSTLYSL